MEEILPIALGALLAASVLYNIRQAKQSASLPALWAQLEEFKAERDAARLEIKELERSQSEYIRQLELSQQSERHMRAQMEEWKRDQEEFKKATAASVMQVGQTLSSKLLEDYERKAEEERKKREAELTSHREDWLKRYAEMVEQFGAVSKKAEGASAQMEQVMRALTNPGGAGQMSEVGLENALKNLGLERGRDYFIQPHVTGEQGAALRPDAMIFLPNDMVIVIDSKASKHIIDLAGAEGTPAQKETEAKLVKTMHEHIRALAGRDYKTAVERMFKEAAHGGKVARVFNVMYVHSDAGLDKIRSLDPDFDMKLLKADIFPASAATLYGLFSLAKQSIAEARQTENAEKITEAVRDLMEGFVTAFVHYEKVGRSMESAVKSFSAFGKSVNRSVIGRMHRLGKLGVEPAKNKAVPGRLATYEIHSEKDLLNLEAEEAELIPLLEKEEA